MKLFYFKKKLSFKVLCSALILLLGGGLFFYPTNQKWQIELGSYVAHLGWTHYVSSEGRFSVDFPTTPVIENKQLVISQANRTFDYQEAKSYSGQNVCYAASYVDLPKRWTMFSSALILKTAVKVLVNSLPDAKLVGQETLSYHKHPAIDFHYVQGSEEVHGRLVLAGATLFQVKVISESAIAGEMQQDPFLDSLVIESTG